MRAGPHKDANRAAVLLLYPELFRRAFSIGANRLMHIAILGNAVAKRTATDNLLFGRRKLIRLQAELEARKLLTPDALADS